MYIVTRHSIIDSKNVNKFYIDSIEEGFKYNKEHDKYLIMALTNFNEDTPLCSFQTYKEAQEKCLISHAP